MSAPATFSERVGGVLLSPLATLRAVADSPSGRGTSDIAWLIAARLVAGETPRLLRAIFRGLDRGPLVGLQGLLMAAQQVLPDVLGILAAGLLMGLFAGRRPKDDTRADPLDLAAYAWVPYLTVSLAGSLVFTLLGAPPSPTLRVVMDGAAVAWALVVWTLGLTVLRAARKEPA
jgi:hypothetical protein